MRISDRSSDVCSSDLVVAAVAACKHPRRRQPGDFLAILLGVHLHGTHTHDRRDIGPRKRGIEIATHRTAIARAITAPEAEHEGRYEEGRVGNECVSRCRSRWSTYN